MATVLLQTSVYSGAWVQKKKNLYLKASVSYLRTSQEFNHLGDKINIFEDFEVFRDSRYQEFTIKAYAEYGLTNRLTLIANLPFKFATTSRTALSNYFVQGQRDESATTTGLADLELKTRLGILINGPLAIALQPGIKIPLGYDTSDNLEGPKLGTGDIDLEGMLLVGKSLHPLPVYFSGGIGYRHRTGILHDEVFFVAETGVTYPKLNVKLEFSGLQSTSTPPDLYGQTLQLPLPGGGGVLPTRLFGDQDISKLSGEIVYKLNTNLGISAEATNLVAGKNIVAGTTFALGLVLLP